MQGQGQGQGQGLQVASERMVAVADEAAHEAVRCPSNDAEEEKAAEEVMDGGDGEVHGVEDVSGDEPQGECDGASAHDDDDDDDRRLTVADDDVEVAVASSSSVSSTSSTASSGSLDACMVCLVSLTSPSPWAPAYQALLPIEPIREPPALPCACKMIVHAACLERWLERTGQCPICHSSVPNRGSSSSHGRRRWLYRTSSPAPPPSPTFSLGGTNRSSRSGDCQNTMLCVCIFVSGVYLFLYGIDHMFNAHLVPGGNVTSALF